MSQLRDVLPGIDRATAAGIGPAPVWRGETVFDAEDQLDPASDAVADPLTVEIDLDAEVERERLAALSARNEPSAGAEPARSDDGALGP